METLEQSRVCRLCGKQAGLTIKIFDKRGNHVKKINSVLPIVVHEMDLLPKHMCHSCNFKLHEFHKFYEDCRKTDADLKSQLSWMRGSDDRGQITLPMVQISNVQIKTEPPDYDEGESTEVALNNENSTNFVSTNCATFPERIFQSAGAKCTRCGCYCGNRNRVSDETKSCSKTRANRHSCAKKNNEDFPNRDTIRRNLFATEIFGHKKIQTEIPICNIPRETLFDRIGSGEARSNSNLERLGCRQDGGEPRTNDKMVSVPGAAHNLRPRKRRIRDLPSSVPFAGATKRPKGRSQKSIAESVARTTFEPVEIKREISEDRARSLRPRIEAIDYSESKKKNPMARANILTRRTGSSEIRRKIATTKCKKNVNVASAIAVKLENPTFGGISKIAGTRDNLKRSLLSRKTGEKSPKMAFDKFLNGLERAEVSSKTFFHGLKTRANYFENRRISEVSSRKSTETNNFRTSFCLRSQRGHLRNGKSKEKFESFFQKPKKSRHRNVSADSTKRKQSRSNDEPSAEMIFKYRDCYMCNARFASSELYRLHGCYANQWH